MRLRARLLGLPLSVAVGCASQPIFVNLEAQGPPSARATVSEIGAETDPEPFQCTTPCRVEFPPGAVLEIELEAAGYYPARLAIEYVTVDQFKRSQDADEPPLVIPMVARPEP